MNSNSVAKTEVADSQVANTRRSGAVGRVQICIGLFVVADLLLIRNAWFLAGDRLLVALALPLSQCSLVALWAACSRASPYLRFAAPPLAAVTSWYVLTQILPWGIGDPVSAAWAIALVVQMLAIIIAVQLGKHRTDLNERQAADESGASPSPLSFNIRTLMLWTTVIAVGFGFVQFGQSQWQWTADVAKSDFIKAIPIIGLFNAILAILWLWALAAGCWQWRSAKIGIVLLLVGLLGFSLSQVIGSIAGMTGFSVHETFVMAAAQSVLLAGSLVVVLATHEMVMPK
jgi:hypothetical protein